MSQKIVFEILTLLGGTATTRQIADRAKQLYPEASLHTYVYTRLDSLRKWGYIKKNSDGTWSVLKDYP